MRLLTLPRVLAAAWLGLACYCLLSLSFGKGGVLASTSSTVELASMRANIESLRELNGSLSNEIKALQNDPDRARREALPLGWIAKGDYEIVVEGRDSGIQPRLSAGRVLPATTPTGLADADIKATSLLVCLLAFALSLLRDRQGFEQGKGLRKKHGRYGLKRGRKAAGKAQDVAASSPIAGSLA
ncbi:MAG TPA: hypothetical protein VMV83_08535 [Rectinemataceae bacterium]|nr:hypothetical protein [Rectinemataceae bacterium]